jgi:hypothetical protein
MNRATGRRSSVLFALATPRSRGTVDRVDGPDGPPWPRRMVVATTDPPTVPDLATGSRTSNLPHPQRAAPADVPAAPADLARVVRLSGWHRGGLLNSAR